jgi:tetratricopeptide (TPR) repeat protein
VAICRRLVAAGRAELEPALATALFNHGLVLQALGRLADAEACLAESVAVLRRLIAAGRAEMEPALANALIWHGNMSHEIGQFDQAVACYEESADIWRRRTAKNGQRNDYNSLSVALAWHYNELVFIGKKRDAARCQSENVQALRYLYKDHATQDIFIVLLESFREYGSILAETGDVTQSEEIFRELLFRYDQSGQSLRDSKVDELALWASIDLARVQSKQEHYAEAVTTLQDSLARLALCMQGDVSEDVANAPSTIYSYLADAYISLSDWVGAADATQRMQESPLVPVDSDGEVNSGILKICQLRGKIAEGQGHASEALARYAHGRDLAAQAVAKGQRELESWAIALAFHHARVLFETRHEDAPGAVKHALADLQAYHDQHPEETSMTGHLGRCLLLDARICLAAADVAQAETAAMRAQELLASLVSQDRFYRQYLAESLRIQAEACQVQDPDRAAALRTEAEALHPKAQ